MLPVRAIALPADPDVTAPDGSEVRILAHGEKGSMAHFTLAPGQIAHPVVHRTVEELWFVLAGRGRIWMGRDGDESIVDLRPGQSVAIPVGIVFQFRNDGDAPLTVVGVTMPPWPGMDEARATTGPWPPTAA